MTQLDTAVTGAGGTDIVRRLLIPREDNTDVEGAATGPRTGKGAGLSTGGGGLPDGGDVRTDRLYTAV